MNGSPAEPGACLLIELFVEFALESYGLLPVELTKISIPGKFFEPAESLRDRVDGGTIPAPRLP